MKSGKILMVRHGQDTDNALGILNGHRDTELTELGREQARATAERLVGGGIEVVYCSPLKRAYETARIIADRLGIDEIIADRHLMERDFGILTGKGLGDIGAYAAKRLRTERVEYFLEAEGVEDFPSCYARAKSVLGEIVERHPGGIVLIVTHGDIGKMLRAAYHGWTWDEGLRTPYYDNAEIIELRDPRDNIIR